MAQAIKNPKISFRTTALALVTTFLVVGAFEIKALKAYEEKKIGYRKVGAEYCISCHKDAKTIRRMREKEDGVGDLFNSDGTFKDKAFEKYNPDYKHNAPIAH